MKTARVACLLPLAALAAVGVVALLGSGCDRSQTSDGPSATAVQVRTGVFEDVLEETGVIAATRVVPVPAPFRGMVIQLAETGTMVQRGDVILVLEDQGDRNTLEDRLNELKTVQSQLEANIEQLQIAMRSNMLDVDLAESELQFQRVRLEDVNAKLAETEVLLQQQVVPQEDLRSAEYRVSSGRLSTVSRDLDLRSQVVTRETQTTDQIAAIDRTALRGTRALRRLNEAQRRLDSATVRAPVSGMVLRTQSWNWSQRRNTETRAGDNVRQGQIVAEIPDFDTLVVRSQVPEGDLSRLEMGAPARVRFDAYGGLVLRGHVTEIGKVAVERETTAAGALVQSDGYSGQKVFEITIELDEKNEILRPGISAQVSLVIERQENVVMVPVGAVQRRDGKPVVTVVSESGGSPREREVTLGARNSQQVVITSGLQPGEWVLKTHDTVLAAAPAAR